ncbi:MAG: DUF167 domain-containing protein [Candidatus Asgardarchaeia archaeon]
MIIKVFVIPNSKSLKVEKDEDSYLVWVDAPAKRGKANKKLIEALSEYFKVNRSSIRIKKGLKSREKIVEIDTL